MTGRNAESVSGALHNMSAPPRTRVTVRPLGAVANTGGEPAADSADVVRASTGLVPVVAISVERLIRQWFPDYLDTGRRGPDATWRDLGRLEGKAARLGNLRLRCLVVLSRLAVGEMKRPNRPEIFRLADTPVEALEAIYLDNVRRLDPLDHGLPPFGLVQSADGEGIAWETEPARALAVLSRCGGTVYSAGREPRLPDYNWPISPVRLYGVTNPEEWS
jgi:hypothetical protein